MTKEAQLINQVIDSIDTVIHGKKSKIKLCLATWLSGGHILLEDVPGTGKTILAKSIAKISQVDYHRAQFTPDLLPSDLVGTTFYDQESNKFKFLKGPLHTDLFLGDEINRATPRTQSALLEAMAEGQITVDNKTYPLAKNFLVIATQNPVEQHGTFPLPEAQLDRFRIKISLGYPSNEAELLMAKNRQNKDPLNELAPLLTNDEITHLKNKVREVKIKDELIQYCLDIVNKTRNNKSIALGASPRATLALIELSKAMALIDGEAFVRPKTIYKLASFVLAHRISLTAEAKYSGVNVNSVIEEILASTKTPTE